jgi:hypothetical protein
MGYEYRFSCTPKALSKMEAFLLRRGWEHTERDSRLFEFWSGPKEPSNCPVATLVLEDSGIYFCDHGGAREHSAVLFRDIIDEALTYSDGADSIVVTSTQVRSLWSLGRAFGAPLSCTLGIR